MYACHNPRCIMWAQWHSAIGYPLILVWSLWSSLSSWHTICAHSQLGHRVIWNSLSLSLKFKLASLAREGKSMLPKQYNTERNSVRSMLKDPLPFSVGEHWQTISIELRPLTRSPRRPPPLWPWQVLELSIIVREQCETDVALCCLYRSVYWLLSTQRELFIDFLSLACGGLTGAGWALVFSSSPSFPGSSGGWGTTFTTQLNILQHTQSDNYCAKYLRESTTMVNSQTGKPLVNWILR